MRERLVASSRVTLFNRTCYVPVHRKNNVKNARRTRAQSWRGRGITITRREEIRDRAIYSHGEESPRVQRAAPLLRVNSLPLGAPTCDATGLMNGLAVSRGKGREVSEAGEISLAIGKSRRDRSSISGRRQPARSLHDRRSNGFLAIPGFKQTCPWKVLRKVVQGRGWTRRWFFPCLLMLIFFEIAFSLSCEYFRLYIYILIDIFRIKIE